ncbi:hypothetical protein INR49_002358 [Caranx melampygus]|nr:hypothetical protein INR49_002358 [Caranx melampygus]
MPQKISLSLRPGPRRPDVVQPAGAAGGGLPGDLYYLMDLSLSMKDDWTPSVTWHQAGLRDEEATSNFRLGFGTFIQTLPHCVPTFGFRHILSLTDKVGPFQRGGAEADGVAQPRCTGGGFDAILQAAVCKNEIGWRKEAYHLLVFATDDVPHLALDGRLGGLVQPHDGQCHLNEKNEYSASTKMLHVH